VTHTFEQIVEQVRDFSSAALSELVDRALGHGLLVLNQQHRHTGDDEKLRVARPAVVKRFSDHIKSRFDGLLGSEASRQADSLESSTLSLMGKDLQDANIALEGMAKHARNCHINEYLRFAVRINARFYRVHFDETNNPLDPGNLAEIFRQAVNPVGLCSAALLDVYRQFNRHVFREIASILKEANEILARTGIKPSLENLGRTRESVAFRRSEPRASQDANTRAFRAEEITAEQQIDESPGLLSVLVDYLHEHNPNGLDAFTCKDASPTDNRTRVIGTRQLLKILVAERAKGQILKEFDRDPSGLRVTRQVTKLLTSESESGQRLLLDQQCSDVVSLTSLLFDAIRRDGVVPRGPKSLLGKAWLTVLQATLADPGLFDKGGHPIWVLLNELAAAGICWTHNDQLLDDRLYQRARTAVLELASDYNGNFAQIEKLAEDFISYKRQFLKERSGSSDHLLSSSEGKQRLQALNIYASRKIAERISDQTIPPLVRDLLENHYVKFLVKVLGRDGAGGDSWKSVMDTVDVLLWSVTPGKSPQDIERLNRINDRLITNLGSALKLADVEKTKRDEMLRQIRALQQDDILLASDARSKELAAGDEGLESDAAGLPEVPDHGPNFDRCLEDVRNLPIGMWLEFNVHGIEPIRCTLVSKIPSIDRYIFVNRQGIKVVEKSESGLARELADQSARLIDNGRLVERALDAVIADFRSLG
jgi:hypothetical protein